MAAATQPAHDFEALYVEHRRYIISLCSRYVGNSLAEDLAQQTFLRAWSKWNNFEDRSSVRTWLHTIAVNVCLNHLRESNKHQDEPIDGDAFPSDRWEPPDPFFEKLVRGALDQLVPCQRGVVELIGFQGLTYQEAAASLKITVGSAKRYMSEARDRLYGVLRGGQRPRLRV